MPVSSLSSTFPAVDPTIHQAPPLSIPSRTEKAPRPLRAGPGPRWRGSRRAGPAHRGRATVAEREGKPAARVGALAQVVGRAQEHPVGHGRRKVERDEGGLVCRHRRRPARHVARPGTARREWSATPAAQPSWSQATAVPTAPTIAARRNP